MSEKHCETCICGKRAPVMNDHHLPRDQQHGHGTITWDEHLEVYAKYAAKYGRDQSAERMVERGGFYYSEIVALTGAAPKTWRPAR